MPQSHENSGESTRFGLPPVEVPGVPEKGKQILWTHHSKVDDPNSPSRVVGPHDIEAIGIDSGNEPKESKAPDEPRPSLMGWFKEQSPVRKGVIVFSAALLALGAIRGCSEFVGTGGAPIGDPQPVAAQTFQGELDLVESRNPSYPLFTDAPLDLLLDSETSDKISVEIIEVDLSCQDENEPVLLLLGHAGADTGHFQRVDPDELNPVAIQNLEAGRLAYEASLRENSGVERTRTKFHDGELNTVFTTLGRGICDIGNVYELKPQITAQEVFISEEAGPVDQSSDGGFPWGLAVITLVAGGVVAIAKKLKII